MHMYIHVFADSDSEPEDNVRLWEQGWKERYYNNKFGVPSDDDEFTCSLAEQYTRGLCWVLGYYYQVPCICTCICMCRWSSMDYVYGGVLIRRNFCIIMIH